MAQELTTIKVELNCDGKPMASIQGTVSFYGITPYDKFYEKPEVDAVLAEKDEKIDELEEHVDELQKATDSAWSKVNAMYDELRHQKYKRCLTMVKRCEDKIDNPVQCDEHDDWLIITEYWNRWHKRWLELAEKFKPSNTTAQQGKG